MEKDWADDGSQDGVLRAEGDTTNSMLDSIRKVMEEVTCNRMSKLQSEVKKELVELRSGVCEDMKKQMDGLTSEIDQKLQEVTGEIQGAVRRLGEVGDRVVDIERWDIGVKDTLTQLLKNQQAMQNKITDPEGRSRRTIFGYMGCQKIPRVYPSQKWLKI